VAVSESPSSAPFFAQSRRRLAWMLWAALGDVVVFGALIVLLNRTHRSPATNAAEITNAPTPPPVTWPAGKRRAPSFSLTDQHRRPVSLAAYRGRPVIVTFIDPLCRNFCPLEAKQLNELMRTVPARQRPAIVAVSVNVYGNAQRNLLEDVAKWQLVPQWRWAVGSPRELASVWRDYEIGVQVATKRIAGVTVHEISHTEAAYLVDGRGFERAVFLWPFRAGDVKAELATLSAST